MDPKILVAIDIEHQANAVKALKEAAKLAQCVNGEIHVCYVLAYGFYDYVKPFLVEEVVKDSIAHVKMELVALVKEAGLSDELVYRHVLKGGVHQQILLLAETLAPSYLIVNASQPDAMTGIAGPVTAQLAHLAPCSLLIVR
ncbi:Universal stress protein family protein [Cohaesibacter marisflavi]|uniref:Universal stress protein family protein n=1 Tax=Cohaesibacter marisflavi TaxID=655353 RepID=A0A1I5IQV4_9HYPH|nr:universal stress protein [Cohaesibacter marisflavi]SFO62872.1 Universal stress protein family protein [Cohaesibacter marisflavi]